MSKKEGPLDRPGGEEEKQLAAKNGSRLDASITFKNSQGYYEEWAEYQRFWDSDHWPETGGDNANFPRPVTNHFNEIIEMKVSGLTYELAEMYFEPKKGNMENSIKIPVQPIDPEVEPWEIDPAELLAAAAENIMEHNDMEQKVESFCRSAGLLGDGVLFSLFNNEIIGGVGESRHIGEIEVVEIDISDFHVGDPTETDLQKQPYIMITERVPQQQAVALYSQFSDSAGLIQPESSGTTGRVVYDHEKISNTETDYVTLIHCWERGVEEEEGEVAEVKVKKKFQEINYLVTCQDYVLRYEKDHYRDKRYPFARFAWYPRRKSFYSKSESRDLINNQKELNRLQGIALLGAYKTGLPNIRYKEGFVKREELAQGPGGHIIADETPAAQGWGVDYMQPPTIASYIPLLKDAMAQGMKDTSGVHEAWSGKAPSAHLNASAIMALQEAAGVRIRGIQRRMHSALRDMGRSWLAYMMEYYTEDRLFKVYGKNNVEGLAWFKKQDFEKMEFEVKVTMSSASPYSKSTVAAVLESMVEKGIIDGDLYLRMLPPEVFPKVKELLDLTKERVEEQNQMVMDQQMQVIDEMTVRLIEQARAAGVPITPDVLQELMGMVQSASQEQEV